MNVWICILFCGLKSNIPIFKMTFWYMMFQAHLVFSILQPQTQPFLQGSMVPFSGERYLEKTWALMCSLWLGSRLTALCHSQIELRHVHMYTNTHIHMSMFISEFCICIHVKNHGFIWIPPTPKKTVFIIAYFLIYNFLIQQRKYVLSLSTIYSLICSNSVCTKTVSEFLNNISVRNTFTT